MTRGHDAEDKAWWVATWQKPEQEFVDQVAPIIGVTAAINPQKRDEPWAVDLVVEGRPADLKCQRTPFFKAGILYGLDPRFTVTFNKKDYVRCQAMNPQPDVVWWIDWKETSMRIGGRWYEVERLRGVGITRFSHLERAILSGKAPLHTYRRRIDDSMGNAKDSYLIDLRKSSPVALDESPS